MEHLTDPDASTKVESLQRERGRHYNLRSWYRHVSRRGVALIFDLRSVEAKRGYGADSSAESATFLSFSPGISEIRKCEMPFWARKRRSSCSIISFLNNFNDTLDDRWFLFEGVLVSGVP